MVLFRAKIRVIPNVSYERALICTIKYICYEYSLTNNKNHLNCCAIVYFTSYVMFDLKIHVLQLLFVFKKERSVKDQEKIKYLKIVYNYK